MNGHPAFKGALAKAREQIRKLAHEEARLELILGMINLSRPHVIWFILAQ